MSETEGFHEGEEMAESRVVFERLFRRFGEPRTSGKLGQRRGSERQIELRTRQEVALVLRTDIGVSLETIVI